MLSNSSKEQYALLERIFKLFSVIGLIAYLPALIACIIDKLWLAAVIDTFVYALIVTFAYFFHPRFEVKLCLLVASAMAVGTAAIAVAGQYSIGYLWLLVAVILSSLFGRKRMIVVTLCGSVLVVAVTGIMLLASADSKGLTVASLAVITTSILVVSILLAIIIRQLLQVLSKALAESSHLAQRLSDELNESNAVRLRLQANLVMEETLRRELQHRVRNNLQVVLSLMSSSGEDENCDEPCMVSARRRIRVLSAVNDVFLSSESSSLIDAYALVRTVIQRSNPIAVDRIGVQGKAVLSDASFSPQVASVASVILSDIMAAYQELGVGTSLLLKRIDRCIRVEIHPDEAALGTASATVFNTIMKDRIAAGSAPDVTIGLLADVEPAQPGLYLDTRIG
jgi:hypothetical protein